MSELQDLLVALDGVTKDAEQHAAQMAHHARQLGQAASSAAHATQGSGRADSKQTAAALESAQRSISQAAQHLHQAALAGKGFVARYAGGGVTGGGVGQGGGYHDPGSTATPLSRTDITALDEYTGTAYREINESLRGNEAMASDTNQRAAAISEALSKLPDQPGPVFRGTSLSPEQIARYVPGAMRSEAGFTSTTSDSKAAFPGSTLFLVISKHGKDVSPYSKYPSESEILFDKGTDFLVTSNFYSPQERKQVIIMMEV